jgi:four helix bundle protein
MREKSKTFQDLIVWQKAHAFVIATYQLTRTFPASETYGLSMQFRRAAVSIAANIAEGFRKRSKADKARILNIAQGSLEECRYYVILTSDLKYGDCTQMDLLLQEVSKLLGAYTQALLTSVS